MTIAATLLFCVEALNVLVCRRSYSLFRNISVSFPRPVETSTKAFPEDRWGWGRKTYETDGSQTKLLLWLEILARDRIMGFFYAVARGRAPGVYMTWSECESQVKGFPNARYKKFPSQQEAEAFIEEFKDVGRGGQSGTNIGKKPLTVAVDGSSGSFITAVGNPIGNNLTGFHPQMSTQTASKNVLAAVSRKRTLMCEPLSLQPLSRGLSTSKSVDSRSSVSKKEFTTGKGQGSKRPKLCDSKEVDLSSFEIDEDGYVVVYTDGACRNNGKGGARAGIGVWFGESHFLNISERVKSRQTNNSAEIQAAERAVRAAKQYGISKLSLKTDSQFLLNCIQKWMPTWKRNNWKKSSSSKAGKGNVREDVINKDDLLVLDKTMAEIEVKWSYIKAHHGHVGNEAADKLAVEGSLKPL